MLIRVGGGDFRNVVTGQRGGSADAAAPTPVSAGVRTSDPGPILLCSSATKRLTRPRSPPTALNSATGHLADVYYDVDVTDAQTVTLYMQFGNTEANMVNGVALCADRRHRHHEHAAGATLRRYACAYCDRRHDQHGRHHRRRSGRNRRNHATGRTERLPQRAPAAWPTARAEIIEVDVQEAISSPMKDSPGSFAEHVEKPAPNKRRAEGEISSGLLHVVELKLQIGITSTSDDTMLTSLIAGCPGVDRCAVRPHV